MDRIRLRYASIINYISLLYRILIAIGFLVIISRKLSIEEFGLWGIILSLTMITSSIVRLWGFWVQRYYSRGLKESANIGLTLSVLYIIPATIVFIVLGYVEELILGWGFEYILYSTPLLMLTILNVYNSMVAGISKPELIGYSSFIYESLRIILAYILVVAMNLGLLGAILSLEISLAISIAYSYVMLYLNGVYSFKRTIFSSKIVAEWFKAFYIPLLNMILAFLRTGVRAYTSWITASEIPVAYLNIGFSSHVPLMRMSDVIAPILYARVLRKPRGLDVEEMLKIYIVMSGFLLATFFSLSKVIALVYNPVYVDAHVIIPLVSVYALVYGLTSIYATVIRGVEHVDEKGIASHRKLLSSYLFKTLLIQVLAILFAYILSFVLVRGFAWNNYLLEAVVIALSLSIPFIIILPYFYVTAMKVIPHQIPVREVLSTLISALTISLYYKLSGASSITTHSFWVAITLLLPHIIIAAILYLALMFILSSWFRGLVKAGLKTIGLTRIYY